MKRMDLQMFTDAVRGRKLVYLYRILANAATDNGTIISFVTENGRTASVDSDTTATKDGPIRTPGNPDIQITSTSILAKSDTMIDALENAMLTGQKVECWEANLDEPGTNTNQGKYKGKYYQGYITEIEKTSSAEDMVELSITYAAEGIGADGYVTVTAEQQDAASYVFADTPKTGV